MLLFDLPPSLLNSLKWSNLNKQLYNLIIFIKTLHYLHTKHHKICLLGGVSGWPRGTEECATEMLQQLIALDTLAKSPRQVDSPQSHSLAVPSLKNTYFSFEIIILIIIILQIIINDL